VGFVITGCGDGDGSPPSEPAGELVFVADANVAGPAVALEAAPEPGVLRVVARDLPPVYGVAFRLSYQAGALEPSSLEAVDAWPADRIVMGREASPGSFFGVVSAKGPFAGLDAGGRELARVVLATPPTAETPIAFDLPRSAVLSPDGNEAPDVAFVGGRIERR
jgi:hypothetical protein